jgi:hypothetical protein
VDGEDLDQFIEDFGQNGRSDADNDGDSDGNDFLEWQQNLGTGSSGLPIGSGVPEPRMAVLCCLALPFFVDRRRHRNRWTAAVLVGIGAATIGVQPAEAATVTLSRSSRAVTSAEAAGGAPTGGMVHDVFVTSDADLLVLGPVLDVSVYKHPYNSNHEAPNPELVEMFPAVGASSFLRLPGSTTVLGGGFSVAGSAWGDFTNDGPQNQFQFGRLTTSQIGTLSGTLYVRGAQEPIAMPFSLSLPGAGEGLMAPSPEQISLFGEAPVESSSPPTPEPARPDMDGLAKKEPSNTVFVELSRRSRATFDSEKHSGAPNGYVHEFFVTSSSDLISVANVEIDTSVYQREKGHGKLLIPDISASYAALSADSFITTPGASQDSDDSFLGHNPAESIWSDETDDVPLKEFLFARLTVSETGSFAGEINVRGPAGAVSLPFEFVLPGVEGDLELLEKEQTYRLSLAFDELAAGVPEPHGLALVGLAAAVVAVGARRERRG